MISARDVQWQPAAPSDSLAGTLPSFGRRWLRYLAEQGYTPDERTRMLDGDGADPGLVRLVPVGLSRREPDDRGPDAVQGLVVAYLQRFPPVGVLDLNPAPHRNLSPAELGERLFPIAAESSELGQVFVDVLTQTRWVATAASVEQLGHVVAAAALYSLVGLAAPGWRLVELDGVRHAAARVPREWFDLGDDQGELDRGKPADVWLANRKLDTRGAVRARKHEIPGLPNLIRWDLWGTLGYKARGRRDRAFTSSTKWTASSQHVAMLRRIVRVPDGRIRRAVQVGGLSTEQGAALMGTLIARRENLRAELSRLTGGSRGQ